MAGSILQRQVGGCDVVHRLIANAAGCASSALDSRHVPRSTLRNDPKQPTRTPMALPLNDLCCRVFQDLAL